MSFLSGHLEETPQGRIVRDLQPVKLSGPQGLLARYILSLPPEETAAWHLPAGHISRLLGHGLFFRPVTVEWADQEDLYQVIALRGTTLSQRTEILVDFTPYRAESRPEGTLLLPSAEGEPELSEALALSGGTRGGAWKWIRPTIELGAAVFEKHATPS